MEEYLEADALHNLLWDSYIERMPLGQLPLQYCHRNLYLRDFGSLNTSTYEIKPIHNYSYTAYLKLENNYVCEGNQRILEYKIRRIQS